MSAEHSSRSLPCPPAPVEAREAGRRRCRCSGRWPSNEPTFILPMHHGFGSREMNRTLLLSVVLFLTACAPGRGGDSDAADRAAIIDLQNRYVLAMDYFDADGYAAVLTGDGVLESARGEVKGRAAIREVMPRGPSD